MSIRTSTPSVAAPYLQAPILPQDAAKIQTQCGPCVTNHSPRSLGESPLPGQPALHTMHRTHAPVLRAHLPILPPPPLQLRMAKGGPFEAERLSAVESWAEGGMPPPESSENLGPVYPLIPPYHRIACFPTPRGAVHPCIPMMLRTHHPPSAAVAASASADALYRFVQPAPATSHGMPAPLCSPARRGTGCARLANRAGQFVLRTVWLM